MEDLSEDTKKMLRKAFTMFDSGKTGFVEADKMSDILTTLGQSFDPDELDRVLGETDKDGEGKLNFDKFSQVVAAFFEDDDDEAMQEELKEAFRMYDKEGNGYITTGTLREILKELDNKLSEDDLDGIIDEIDEDGSGTVDFDEFMEMMAG